LGSLPRKGLKEAGSLGEVRQVPLSPVGNPAENITIARPKDRDSSCALRAKIGSTPFRLRGWLIFQNLRSSDFPAMPGLSVTLWFALRVSTAIHGNARLDVRVKTKSLTERRIFK
jgi:hypothetical protein